MLYPIAIESTRTESCNVVVPDVPGCHGSGNSIETAVRVTEKALREHFERLYDSELSIPLSSDIEVLKTNPAYDGRIWMLIEIDLTLYLGKSEKINVTLPEIVIKRIDDIVGEVAIYKSRSRFLLHAALRELKKSKP